MTVLLTGATGMLGRALIDRLLSEGHAVRALTRRPFLASTILPPAVDVCEWHPSVEPAPRSALEGIDTVFHLAGDPLCAPMSRDRLENYRRSRSEACQHLIALAGHRPWHLIVASVVPTSSDADAVLTEASPRSAGPSEIDNANNAVEAAALAAQASGASVTIARFGLVVAPAGPLAVLHRMAAAGLVPALENCRIPAVDLEDAAAMLASLIGRTDLAGPINAVAPTPLSGTELAAMLSMSRRTPLRMALPQWLVQRRLGMLAPLLFNRARVVPQRLQEIGANFSHPDPRPCTQRALAALEAARTSRPGARAMLLRAVRLEK